MNVPAPTGVAADTEALRPEMDCAPSSRKSNWTPAQSTSDVLWTVQTSPHVPLPTMRVALWSRITLTRTDPNALSGNGCDDAPRYFCRQRLHYVKPVAPDPADSERLVQFHIGQAEPSFMERHCTRAALLKALSLILCAAALAKGPTLQSRSIPHISAPTYHGR